MYLSLTFPEIIFPPVFSISHAALAIGWIFGQLRYRQNFRPNPSVNLANNDDVVAAETQNHCYVMFCFTVVFS